MPIFYIYVKLWDWNQTSWKDVKQNIKDNNQMFLR